MAAMTDQMQPAVFLGHGSPMNTLEQNRFTEAWRNFGESVGRPRAVLCVSAHWFINATAVTAMARPRTIHDFYGFPQELFDFEYPAPGAPDVAEEIVDAVRPAWVGLDHDSWGLDHGTWSVLAHVFPGADVPVLQLSINAQEPFEYHLDLGARLAPLRRRGVLVVGSGNIVHNLRRVDFGRLEGGSDWAERFDESARAIMTSDPGQLPTLQDHPDFALAVPTPDHFLPALYVAGMCAAEGESAGVLIDGCSMGSLSMTSYTLGMAPVETDGDGAAAALPDPATVPPDDTNT
jgi:4,5-DOPA dioxygenase extradiol